MEIKKINLFILFLIIVQATFGQLSLGISSGLQIPGMQDLKFLQFDSSNNLFSVKRTIKVHSNISIIKSANLTAWKGKYGFRIEILAWKNYSIAKKFRTYYLPPFKNIINQSRYAIYFDGLWRFSWFLNKKESALKKHIIF